MVPGTPSLSADLAGIEMNRFLVGKNELPLDY
jgi:hypothetical protein